MMEHDQTIVEKGSRNLFRRIGKSGYSRVRILKEYSKREFEVVKDAEKLNVKKREYITIEEE